jgi:hypothetical protein
VSRELAGQVVYLAGVWLDLPGSPKVRQVAQSEVGADNLSILCDAKSD